MIRFDNLKENDKIIVLNKIKNDKDFRIKYCEYDKKAFAVYYFWNLMTHDIPEFHNQYYDFASTNKNICLIWYRWCAKSGIFWLIDIVHDICYRKEKFIVFLAYNKSDSAWKVRNIVTALKSNKRIVDDFWFLYENEDSRKRKLDKMPESKSISKFITTNSIRVEAFSMDQAARWFVFYDDSWELIRPSKVVADDVAVLANSRNKDIVVKDYTFIMEELLWGVKWRIIFLLNAISEYCITSKLKEQFQNNENWIFHEVSIIDESWNITWPSKYVWTAEEARNYNKNREKRFWVESIEDFKSRWEKSFNVNYMNIPEIVVWDPVFNEILLNSIIPKRPIRKHNLRINWKKFELFVYSESKSVSVWVDVANGWGWDNSSITWTDEFWKLVFQWASNQIEPWELAHLIKAIHYSLKYMIWKNALVIEKNNSWIAVIQELRHDQYIYRLIFRKRKEAQVADTPTNLVWFATTWASKEILKSEIDKRINDKTIDASLEESYELKRYIIDEKWAYNASPWSKDDRVISKWLSFIWLLYRKN